MDTLIFAAGFGIIALASGRIGDRFGHFGLPLISGFLFTGIITGPDVLNLIPREAVEGLGIVDQVSLGLIAFAAGGELYLKEVKSRLAAIGWITAGLVVFTFLATSSVLFAAASRIPFMQEMGFSGRIAVAILAGAILVARSPSSAIAIVNELRARGSFTATVMGVTIVMDVVVIVLFAAASSAADALLTGPGKAFGFVALLAAELSLSLLAGGAVSGLLFFILSRRLPLRIKGGLILLTGWMIFGLSAIFRHYTHRRFGMELLVEPLLVCMVAGFLTANTRRFRKEFLSILTRTGPPVYIAFFTLTGASLSLNILAATWHIALLLFGVRILAIFLGSYTGGTLAGSPPKTNRTYWMAFITQAGVGLGLAKEVVVEFPEWGTPFATIIISTIVLNQIVGPPLFKLAIKRMKEAHPPAAPNRRQGVRNAVIFGPDGQAAALARSLLSQGWQVVLALPKGVSNANTPDSSPDLPVHVIDGFTPAELTRIGCHRATAIVTMLRDEENLAICETAYERFATQTLVTRLNNREYVEAFNALDVLIVDPSTAIVGLLDHFVRAPAAASLLMGFHRDRDVADLPVRNPDLSGLALRDLRLPFDAVIMAVRRRGTLFVPHDFTRLEPGDLVTVMGAKTALKELALRFGRHEDQAAAGLAERAVPPELRQKASGRPGFSWHKSLSAPVQNTGAPADRFALLVENAVIDDIRHPVDRDGFFERVATLLAEPTGISSATLFEMLRQREEESTTVLAPGLAIPHIIIQGERQFAMLIARSKEGIVFSEQAPRVHAAFVLVGTRDERDFHLQALAAIARIVMDVRFEQKWARVRSPQALRQMISNLAAGSGR